MSSCSVKFERINERDVMFDMSESVRLFSSQASLAEARSLSAADSLVSAERRRSSGEVTSPVVLSIFTPVHTEHAP